MKIVALFLAVFIVRAGTPTYGEEKSTRWIALEKLIVQIDFSSWISESLTVSPDCRHVAYAAEMGDKAFVVLDGEKKKQYDAIGPRTLSFSPDSNQMAYAANQGDKYFMIVDGDEGKKYDGIGGKGPIFSPDSKRVAYGAKEGDKYFVVVDGVEGKKYDGAGAPVFSPDSSRVAYGAIADSKYLVVLDEQEGKHYDGVSDPVFSPDSKRLAYVAKEGDTWFIVLDQEEGKKYDGLIAPTFSPDSKRLAYRAQVDSEWFVVVDGKEEKKYGGMPDAPIIFSPDSTRLAYGVSYGIEQASRIYWKGGKRWDVAKWTFPGFMVVDGKVGKLYAHIAFASVTFSPDSKRLAYGAQPPRSDKGWFLVVDGKEQRIYEDIGPPAFSPDSKLVAYGAGLGDKQFVVLDGKEGKRYDLVLAIGSGRVTFDSDDSLYYLAMSGNSIYSVHERIK